MEALEFLQRFDWMAGQGAPVVLFSALRIAEVFKITPYQSRKVCAAVRMAGLSRRVGNQYVLTENGHKVVNALIAAREGMIA